MADLEREDLAAFVSLWSRTTVPLSLVTDSTLKVLRALQDLAADGGVLNVPRVYRLDVDALECEGRARVSDR
ncbi:MAG TPA: hypothetical protein VN803_04020 [Gemmatimonadales bacterium]|nr:hypothetical protein [Gemmatimonadales bacterium]